MNKQTSTYTIDYNGQKLTLKVGDVPPDMGIPEFKNIESSDGVQLAYVGKGRDLAKIPNLEGYYEEFWTPRLWSLSLDSWRKTQAICFSGNLDAHYAINVNSEVARKYFPDVVRAYESEKGNITWKLRYEKLQRFMEEQIAKKDREIHELTESHSVLKSSFADVIANHILELDLTKREVYRYTKDLEKEISEQSETISGLEKIVHELEENIDDHLNELNDRESEIKELEDKVERIDLENEELQERLMRHREEISQLTLEKEKYRRELKEINDKVKHIYGASVSGVLSTIGACYEIRVRAHDFPAINPDRLRYELNLQIEKLITEILKNRST
jgi:regulator of replication initiation timing